MLVDVCTVEPPLAGALVDPLKADAHHLPREGTLVRPTENRVQALSVTGRVFHNLFSWNGLFHKHGTDCSISMEQVVT